MKQIRIPVIKDSDLQATQLNDGQIEVRETLVDEEGDNYYHRYVVHPGMYTGDRDPRVQTLAQRAHTREVITKYQLAVAERARAER